MPKVSNCRIADDGRECSVCREFKAWDQYAKMKRGARGRASYCRDCYRGKYQTGKCLDCGTAVSQKAGRCKSCAASGERNPAWKGRRGADKDGYIRVKSKQTSVREHRYVMEQHLGRKLKRHETVHHRNGVRHDNRIENLELWSSSHPPGQRVEDKISWAIEFLDQYGYAVTPPG